MKMSEDISGLHSVVGTPICEDETGRVVAAFYSESDAAEIVHKVNCHDELVEALQGLTNAYEHLDGAQKSQGSWHSHAIEALAKAKG